MATLGERVASLEALGREFARRLDAVEDNLNGGGDVDYTRSVRGRLHKLEGAQAALGVVTQRRVRLIHGWQAAVITGCAVVTAVAALIAAWPVLTG